MDIGARLGDDFTPSVKAAWEEAYSALSGAMKSAATASSRPAMPLRYLCLPVPPSPLRFDSRRVSPGLLGFP